MRRNFVARWLVSRICLLRRRHAVPVGSTAARGPALYKARGGNIAMETPQRGAKLQSTAIRRRGVVHNGGRPSGGQPRQARGSLCSGALAQGQAASSARNLGQHSCERPSWGPRGAALTNERICGIRAQWRQTCVAGAVVWSYSGVGALAQSTASSRSCAQAACRRHRCRAGNSSSERVFCDQGVVDKWWGACVHEDFASHAILCCVRIWGRSPR